jgi:hypothetical protein
MKPLILYLTWNRLGLTFKSLNQLLKSKHDFELVIIDNNSKDDTNKFLKSLKDPRILKIKFFEDNYGGTHAFNWGIYNYLKKNQNLVTIENDVFINDLNWIFKIEKLFENFENLGLVSLMNTYSLEMNKNMLKSAQIKNNLCYIEAEFLYGNILYFKRDLIQKIGYFNEEICLGDCELGYRVNKTGYKKGFPPLNYLDYKVLDKEIFMCENCVSSNICSRKNKYLNDGTPSCWIKYKSNVHKKIFDKLQSDLIDFIQKNNNPFCASIHDPESQNKVNYNKYKAIQNFEFFSERPYPLR